MAILMQSLCAQLAIASGRDLAQACRDAFPRWASIPIWVLAEGSIIATDLAEVIGTAIGLNLVFGMLMFALTINASFLILAADTFHATGQTDVADIDKAHLLLAPTLGSDVAPLLFGIALLCCGLASTVTATMAGQIVMEELIRLRMAPWARRLTTRLIVIVPAVAVILIQGSDGLGSLLILSQVILSFQLPFAIVPLVIFTASRAKMGDLVSPRWLTLACGLIAAVFIALNVNLLAKLAFG